MKRARATESCPICGTEFKAGRLACPECGSDAETGWKSQEELDYLAVELPELEAVGEYDERTGTYRSPASRGFAIALALALIAGVVIAFLW